MEVSTPQMVIWYNLKFSHTISNIYASDNPCDEKIIGWAPPSHESTIFALQLKIHRFQWGENQKLNWPEMVTTENLGLGKIEAPVNGYVDNCKLQQKTYQL